MDVGYIAYIDEAGDDHIRRIKPYHPCGASEWFILSAVVLRVENEHQTDDWLTRCLKMTNSNQRKDIHFKDMPGFKKSIICAEAAKLDARFFVVMSNKKNMVKYNNPRLHPGGPWMYWWITRVLMERVTTFCGARAAAAGKDKSCVEIVFSRRSDLRYWDLIDYFVKLYFQQQNSRLYIDRKLDWSVVDFSKIYALPHKQRSGLQLADVVSSSFYHAVTEQDGRCDVSYARALMSRVYRYGKKDGKAEFLEHGVKPMPSIPEMGLSESQRELFKLYGYDGEWESPNDDFRIPPYDILWPWLDADG